MTRIPLAAALLAASTLIVGGAAPAPPVAPPRAARALVVLDNPRVRAFRTADGSLDGVDPGPGVVISIEDGPGHKAGDAIWMDDVTRAPQGSGGDRGPKVIVQPRRGAAASAPPADGSKPGDAPFVGMSFTPLFENDRVAVLRARMDVGAREGVHTHGSDTIVVHLSGGDVEDTAGGKTKVNHWKRGDVEFEARGSSHSGRNAGHAVDVVLVTLKP